MDFEIRYTTPQLQYNHKYLSKPSKMEFHLHDRFEVYFFISGNVHFLIEKQVYPMAYGDLLIMNNRELHKSTFRTDAPYENIVIHFDPELALPLDSLFHYGLLDCFTKRALGEHNKIQLHPDQLDELLTLYKRMDALQAYPPEESGLLLTTYFIEMLVLMNRAFRHNQQPLAASSLSAVPENLASVLDYIDRHLDEDLTLETLEKQVFMNRYYLSRLFRQSTGSTIHSYILMKRISRAKKLLHDGHNVTDACQLSGFNDYSNFIRMFKRIVGMPPGQYRKQKWD